MSAIRKIISFQSNVRRSRSKSKTESSQFPGEKRSNLIYSQMEEENQVLSFTNLQKPASRESSLLSRNKTLGNFVFKKADLTSKLTTSANTPFKNTQGNFKSDSSVGRNSPDKISNLKLKSGALNSKKITILTRRFTEHSGPNALSNQPKTTPAASSMHMFPHSEAQLLITSTGDQKLSATEYIGKNVSPRVSLASRIKRIIDGSTERAKASINDNIKNREVRILRRESFYDSQVQAPPDPKLQADQSATTCKRKPIYIPKNSKIDTRKSRSIDLIKQIFQKRSTDLQKPKPTRSEDKESNRFVKGIGPKLAFLKRSTTPPQKFDLRLEAERPPEVIKNFHYIQLKSYLEKNEDARKALKLVRQAFPQKQDDSAQNYLFSFKTTSEFYKIRHRLGKGCFGEVYLATQVLTGCNVALKVFPKTKFRNREARSKIEKEVSFLQRVGSCDGIIKLLEVFEDTVNVYLVFEFAPNGDLVRYFEKNQLFAEDELRPFFKKILQGVGHLHEQSIVHRDIKLDNILLDQNMNPKLCDFGISTFLEPGKRIFDTGGTPAYLAPEVIKCEGNVCEKTDVWSLGVLLYLLSFGQVPFKATDMQILYHKILSGKYQFRNCEDASPELIDLITKMLVVDHNKRVSIPEILEHPWLVGHQQNSNNKKLHSPERLTLFRSIIITFLTGIGFPESYIRRSIETNETNHVKACFDLLTDKFTK